MILQSLVEYYESLERKGKIVGLGYGKEDISYALEINDNGQLVNVISLKSSNGKRLVPQKMIVPEHVKRSSGVNPNFLSDNSSYFLGVDNKGKPKRSEKCFIAAADLHHKILDEVRHDNLAVNAVLNFFDTWDCEKAYENPAFLECSDDLLSGGNLIFYYGDRYLHDMEDVKRLWEAHCHDKGADKRIICGITGKEDTIAMLHPSIKGIKKAQSSGASLVSFNSQAFCSFAKEQGENARVGQYTAFAYGAALNHLISTMDFRQYIGDTAVICYAKDGDDNYKLAFSGFMFGESEYYSQEDLNKILQSICKGERVLFNESNLDPEMPFYIIGIAPNASRLSIRFFWENSFGRLSENIRCHNERLEIDRGNVAERKWLTIWRILQETVRKGDDPSPVLAGELTRAILNDTRYPATLINAIDIRIRAEHEISSAKAAIIKAYYIKNENPYIPKEVLTVALNKNTDNIPYNLGRLFAVLERIQEQANPGINTTIKDRYFGSASAIPATTFPNLLNLSQKHLKKMEANKRIYFDKMTGEILEKMEQDFPKTLSMPERGAFQLGYYHQRQDMFKGKNKITKED